MLRNGGLEGTFFPGGGLAEGAKKVAGFFGVHIY